MISVQLRMQIIFEDLEFGYLEKSFLRAQKPRNFKKICLKAQIGLREEWNSRHLLKTPDSFYKQARTKAKDKLGLSMVFGVFYLVFM